MCNFFLGGGVVVGGGGSGVIILVSICRYVSECRKTTFFETCCFSHELRVVNVAF